MTILPEQGRLYKTKPSGGGFLKKLGSIFGTHQPEPELDELDVPKPALPEEGIGSKILSYLLPTLVGAVGGVPLQGLASAHFGRQARQQDAMEKQMEIYQKDRESAKKRLFPEPSGMAREVRDFQNMTQEEQDVALKLKTYEKGFVSPFDIQKFQYQIEKDAIDRSAKLQEEANKPLSSEAAKTLELGEGGLRNVSDIRNKISEGNKLVGASLPFGIGDRDTSGLMDDLSDIIGRLRSGGAINSGEESRFKRLIPGALDSREVKLKKLNRLEAQFKGIVTRIKPQKTGLQKTQTGQTPRIQEAVSWANANQNDPRAKEILKRYGN